MSKRKYFNYTLARCDGNIEKLRVPAMFDAFEVKRKRPHSLVFMHIPTNWSVWDDINMQNVSGPAVMYIRGDDKMTFVPTYPKTESEAYHLTKGLHEIVSCLSQ